MQVAGCISMVVVVLMIGSCWGRFTAPGTVQQQPAPAVVANTPAAPAAPVSAPAAAPAPLCPAPAVETTPAPSVNVVQQVVVNQQQPVATSAPRASYIPTQFVYVNGYGQVPYANGYVYIGSCWRPWGAYGGYRGYYSRAYGRYYRR